MGSTVRTAGPGDTRGLRADQRRRWRAGEAVPVEAYLTEHPSLKADTDGLLDLIYNEVVLRAERGEQPTFAEYERRFPELAEPIRLQFEVFDALSTGTWADPGAPEGPAAVPRPAGYDVLGELGRGGMGVVYRAVHRALNRPVALKVLRAGGLAGADELARFRRESEATARLQHPNVVQIFEVGEVGGRPFLALEYLDGGTLADRVADGPLDPRAAAELVRTLAAAVGHAHERGIVHRDLKPANVLLAFDGTPKIADFGLAKLARGDDVTQSAVLVGSPSYMAPEQAGGPGPVGPVSDVYALGAVLYECLTGRPPFVGPTPIETLEQVRSAEPVAPRRLQPKVPRDLETVCLKCLEKRADRRYSSAAALADDLGRFLDGRPVRARPVGAVGRSARWARRKPTAAALAVVSGASLLLMVTGLSVGLVVVEDRRRAAETSLDRATAANREKDEALQGEQAARAAERQADYATRIALAFRAWSANEVPQADATLDGCPPEYRHWEWAYLKRLCHGELAILDAGGEPVAYSAVVVSPDARLVAAATATGSVHVWELATRRKVISLAARASTLTFSPDGRLLATGRELIVLDRGPKPPGPATGTLQVWEVATGKLKHDWAPDPRGVSRLGFGADGKWLASVGPDGMARVRDEATGESVAALPVSPSGVGGRLAVSPDGAYLAVSVEGQVRVWATDTWAERHVLPAGGRVVGLGFGPNRRLVAVTQAGAVRAWDAADGRELATPLAKAGQVGTAVVRPDGTEVAATCRDVSVRLLDGQTGVERWAFRGGSGPARVVAYTPDGRRVVVAFEAPGPLAVWDLDRPQGCWTRVLPPRAGAELCYSPDGRFLAFPAGAGTVALWDADTVVPIRALAGSPLVPHLAFRADGERLAAVTSSALVVWDTPGGDLRTAVPAPWAGPNGGDAGRPLVPRGGVRAAAWSPDGQHLAVAGETGAVTIWAAAGAGLVRVCRTAGGRRTTAVRYSADGRLLAAIGEGGVLSVWDAADGRLLHTLGGPEVRQVFAFSADGRYLAAASGPKSISVWEAATGREVQRLPRSTPLEGLAFSADGRRLVAILASREGNSSELWLWNPQTGQELLTFRAPAGAFRGVFFHPNGRQILAHTLDRVFVWDTAPRTPAGPGADSLQPE